MNADWAPGGRRPLNQATDLAREFAGTLLSSTSTAAIYYYYWARKLKPISQFDGGWNLEGWRYDILPILRYVVI